LAFESKAKIRSWLGQGPKSPLWELVTSETAMEFRMICGVLACSKVQQVDRRVLKRGLVVGREVENGKTLLHVSSRQSLRNAASSIVAACLMQPAAIARSYDVPRTLQT